MKLYYYLDIETTGFNEEDDKIITIQYMALDAETGKPAGQLKILKEWESDEKTILKRFIEDFRPENRWAFVPVGYGLSFEHGFFWQRCISNGFKPISILGRPFLDLMTVGVLLNGGSFKGAALDDMTSKSSDGSVIPGYYKEKKYAEIERYIKDEADGFSNFCIRLYKEMPQLFLKFKSAI
jgi:hypothetical protein